MLHSNADHILFFISLIHRQIITLDTASFGAVIGANQLSLVHSMLPTSFTSLIFCPNTPPPIDRLKSTWQIWSEINLVDEARTHNSAREKPKSISIAVLRLTKFDIFSANKVSEKLTRCDRVTSTRALLRKEWWEWDLAKFSSSLVTLVYAN